MSKIIKEINKKVSLIFIIFAILVVSSFGLLENFFLGNQARQVSLHNAISKTKERELFFKQFLDHSSNTLISINQSKIFNNFLDHNSSANVNDMFMMIAKSNITIMQLRYIDQNGIEKIRVDREEENNQPFFVENKNLNNRTDKHCFLESKNKPLNKVWFSSIDLKMKNGKISVPHKSIFRAIMPVGIDGKFNGIIVIDYSMDNFLKEFLNAPLYDTILANNKGYILVHYNSSKNWGIYQAPKYKINSDFPKFAQDILSKDLVSNKTFVSRKLNLPVEGGLILIMQLNQEYLQSTAQKTYSLYFLSIIIVLIITIVLSYFLSSSIGKMYDKLNDRLKIYNKKLEESYQKLSKKSKQFENERQKYKTIMELASDGVHIIDENGNILEFSRSFADMLRYSDDEMRALNVTDWDAVKEKEDLLNTVKMQTLSPDKFYTKHKRKDGSIIDVQITSNGIELDGKRYVYASARDITERLNAEKELQKQHDFLQKIIDSLSNSVMVIDKNYNITLMNNVSKQMYDEKIIENPLSPKCYEISHHQNMPCDGDSHPCPLQKVMETKNFTKTIHTHLSSSGEERIVELIASPLFDDLGEVHSIIEVAHDITELQYIQNQLKHQAEHDPLTGLPNRILFLDRINQSIKNSQRYGGEVAVLFVDLDHFKDVNDSLGHAIGDLLLKNVAHIFRTTVRQSDTVARLGGDEFAIIINNFDHINDVISVVQNLLESFKKPILINEKLIYVSLSIGISIYPDDGLDSEILVKNADAAMYKVKNSGRNNYQFYTEDMTEQAYEHILLGSQLRQSIEKNQLEVYYQLQINAKENNIIGMEALIRWNHPDMGLISPAKFIPLAEDIGFILQIDEWVMQESIKQFKKWHKDGLNPGVLSLNLSALALERDGFIENIKDMILEENIDTSWLSFEVTESQIMKNPDKSIEKLKDLNNLGIKLSIDDFGTGYSSLSYLKKLPINKLKIDRSFIMDIPIDLDDIEITKTIISMAKNLKLEVIAEGVETIEQRDFLLENGCNEIQGYLYYKPLPANDVENEMKLFV